MGADLPTTPRGKVLCIMLAPSSILTTYSYLGSFHWLSSSPREFPDVL
jgi:hypothetical protein